MPTNHQRQSDSPVSRDTVPSYWGFGSLTSPLVRSDQTHGAYSIIEQLMPANSGPSLHTHANSNEVFYILEGKVHLQLSDSVSTAEAGQLVRVPRGVPHAFAVQSEQARMLIFFMPATIRADRHDERAGNGTDRAAARNRRGADRTSDGDLHEPPQRDRLVVVVRPAGPADPVPPTTLVAQGRRASTLVRPPQHEEDHLRRDTTMPQAIDARKLVGQAVGS
jgi:quercetin dioxygenase-like cupin family protein